MTLILVGTCSDCKVERCEQPWSVKGFAAYSGYAKSLHVPDPWTFHKRWFQDLVTGDLEFRAHLLHLRPHLGSDDHGSLICRQRTDMELQGSVLR